MTQVNKKISSNQVDQTAYLFGIDSDPKALAIDPATIRLVGGSLQGFISGLASGTSQYFSTSFTSSEGEEIVDEGLANLLPKLEDISIKSMVLDYSTTPVSVKLILRIKNSTGYPVKGISGRVPKK